MPLLFGGSSWPSAPIIIPITALVVIAVAVILLIFHLCRKLVGCPHHKSKYPFHDQDPSKIKSVLPTSPYSIDPSSTASSNSIYFVKGTGSVVAGAGAGAAAGGLLYPGLVAASAPSRTPSTGRHHGRHDDSFDRSGSSAGNQDDQTFSLDNVDGPEEIAVLVESLTSPPNIQHQQNQSRISGLGGSGGGEESQSLLINHQHRSGSALTGSTSTTSGASPTPYDGMEERTTYRQEMSYQRSERQEYITTYPGNSGSGGGGPGSDHHYESDV